MSFLPGHFPAGAPEAVEKLQTLTFIQAFGGTGASVNAPADVREGDFIAFINVAGQFGGGVQATVPSGFTLLEQRWGSGEAAFNVSAKIMRQGDGGSSLAGMNGVDFRNILGLHYRGNSKLRSFSASLDADYLETSGNPGGFTIGSSAGVVPSIMFGIAWTSGASSNIEIDGDAITNTQSINANLKASYRIANAGDTPADHFADMGDHGGDNHLLGFYLNFT